MRRLIVTVLTAVFVGIAPSAATGEDDPNKEALQEAQKAFEEGVALYESGEYAQSIVEFRKAHNKVANPVFLTNIAFAQMRLGRLDNVLDTARDTLAAEEIPAKPDAQTRGLQGGARTVLEARSVAERLGARAEASKQDQSTEASEPDAGSDETEATADASPETAKRGPDLLGWSAVGVGGGLLVGGLVNDLASVGRTAQIARARRDRDAERLEQLRTEADRAKTRSVILYGSGAALLAGGVVYKIIRGGPEKRADTKSKPAVRVAVAPVGLFGSIDW